jgi:hypothetical protein
MMIFGDSITNVSMMKSCSPFSKKPIPELDGNMLRKKKSPQTKKRLLKQQMSLDSGRNWVCLFCRATVSGSREAMLLEAPPQARFLPGKSRIQMGKRMKIIQFMVVYSENHLYMVVV